MTQNLQFTNSKSPQASVDRGWKVRSVVTTLGDVSSEGRASWATIWANQNREWFPSFAQLALRFEVRATWVEQYLSKRISTNCWLASIRAVCACLMYQFAMAELQFECQELRGCNTGPVIAFDEAIIPTRSRRNPTRQYLLLKPHKWRIKFFAACCEVTNIYYLLSVFLQHRIELYVGAKSHLAVPPATDNSCGAAAVVRNMDALVPRSSKAPFRLQVLHISGLALELLHRR
ncbi:Hypothetical protein PHPALM_8689 [Phytophthora palmivora]|uniref:PiggyBac transposable element-derived protein domain-containing protein n=1 Tax=Phytophthora palmivora TaxID=4796 RepID=A0A2P4Y973_9STRA|nr:Hypothetical protein PHPALM_8689 [Phytophthora palmivora]